MSRYGGLPTSKGRARHSAKTYTKGASTYLGHGDYAVMQVLVADDHNRFPDEEGCDEQALTPVLRHAAAGEM